MIRTQLSLNPGEISWLKRQAKARGTSMAEVVRQLIESAKGGNSFQKRTQPMRRAAAKVRNRFPFVGLAQDAPPTDALLTDAYLYEEGDIP